MVDILVEEVLHIAAAAHTRVVAVPVRREMRVVAVRTEAPVDQEGMAS
jgi:hypothetical protein